MTSALRTISRRRLLQAGAVVATAGAAATATRFLFAQPPRPIDLGALVPQMQPIAAALHQRACDLVDRQQLVRLDGFIYSIDPAQLMIHFAQTGDANRYNAMRQHAETNLILTEREGFYTRGFVAWRWKSGEKPDASGTTEALRIARGLWLGAKAFNRPADADLALKLLDGYSRHGATDQGTWIIRNYFGLNTHAFASNSYLVDYDADFVREVAQERGDAELAQLADRSYNVVARAVTPCGLLYDIIQPEVTTLYPELNMTAFSPNDVIQFSNCCASAVAVAHGRPEISRRILAFGLNRLADLRAYYLGRTGEPYNATSAAVSEYSILARLAVRLGAESAAATIADRAMNEWRWCMKHPEAIQVYALSEILLALHELTDMAGK